MSAPFSDRRAPVGRAETIAAVESLMARLPVLAKVPPKGLYEITRPYFAAGWSVRDVIWAMDRQPDGSPHHGAGNAWVRGEPRDTTLARLERRLQMWRVTDDDETIMDGGHTAQVKAMMFNARAQEIAQRRRRTEDAAIVEAARGAAGGPGHQAARAAARAATFRRRSKVRPLLVAAVAGSRGDS